MGVTNLSDTPIVSQEQLNAFKPSSYASYVQQNQLPPEILEYVRRDMLNYVNNEVPKLQKFNPRFGMQSSAPQRSTREVYVPNLDKPIFVQYDNYGKTLEQLSFRSDDYGTAYEFKPNTGELRSQGAVIKGGGILSDLAPLILAGVGANLLAPAIAGAGAAGGAGAAAGASASEIAASNALASANLAGYAGTTLPATAAGAGLLSSGSPMAGFGTGQIGADIAANQVAGSTIASQIAAQGATPSLLQQAASFLNVKPETLASFAPSAIQGLLSAGGSYLQSEQAKESAQTQADAQIRAAQIAADSARFRPVGVTTRFGSSNFQTDAAGNVIGAGYTPSAEITGYQDRLRTLAGQGLTQAEQAPTAYAPLTGAAQSLFSLGGSYLKKSPEEVAADYITKQQALLAPIQENQLALLQNKLQQQGRGGLSVAQGGAMGATTPEMQAYYNLLAQSNLVLAAQADQEAQNRIKFGAGLFDTGAGLQGKYYAGQTAAYSPFTTAMDTSSGLERLAQQPLDLSTSIGSKVSTANANVGQLTGQGIINAASTMAPANAYSGVGNALTGIASSPNVTGALNRAFGVSTQPTQQQFTFDPRTGQYVPVQSAFAT
jgi:hypothetical protein